MKHVSLAIDFVFSFTLIFQSNLAYAQNQNGQTLILAGYKTVSKVQTPATGELNVSLKGDSLSVQGSFTNLSSYYFGSAIFYGEKGERGNQIIDLNPTIADNKTSGTFEKSKNTFKLTEGQLEALSNGNLYISIMSFDHQRGELRTQLPPMM
ncbi:MAG: CHRD domain-containing protein [Candidatus Halalkalibacterium sp. M3_1C_030]